MGEDFVRCYIGNIPFLTLRGLQQESRVFDQWELMEGSQFKLKESYGYKQVFIRDEALIEALALRSVVAENRHPESARPSLIWDNALAIADVLTLLSLARATYYPILAVERNVGDTYNLSWGVMAPELNGNWDIVPLSNLAAFISDAIAFTDQNPHWQNESGFKPSVYWYTQAQIALGTAPTILEVALYWVTMEILASTHTRRQGLGIRKKKERVKRFVKDKRYSGNHWDFLDGVIDDWYETRCQAFHEGTRTLPTGTLAVGRQQVRDFTSLVLVEMFKDQGEVRRREIAARMQAY